MIAACRESLVDIVRGSIGSDGEFHPSPDDDPAVLPLARIALHAATRHEEELEVTELEMHFLQLTLKRFSDPEQTKKAVHESSLQFGTISNGEIEQRIMLGDTASKLLVELDADFAEASMEEATRRYLSIPASAPSAPPEPEASAA